MRAEIKPAIEEMLQLRLDGKITSVTHMFEVIDRHFHGDISYEVLAELTAYSAEVLHCDNIPAAKAFAEKYDLVVIT